ncbi:MAG: sensor histidine kinase, partial [Agathobaculum sp.]|jgi:signal transduction histidine kinase
LVKLSRLETGVFTLHPVSHAITPMLEEAAEQLAPKAAQKEIRLTTNPTETDAVFDYKWTTEALCNLMDNAIKYTPLAAAYKFQSRNTICFAALM